MKVKYKLLIALVVSLFLYVLFSHQFDKEKQLERQLSLEEFHSKVNYKDVDNLKIATALNLNPTETSLKVDFIVECTEGSYQYLEKDERTTKDFLNIFKNSENPTSNLAYALSLNNSLLKREFDLEKSNRTTKLVDLIKASDKKSLVHYFLVAGCNENNNLELCDETIIPQALADDSSNGALWLEIASYEASRNNTDGFEFAVSQIIASPNYNEYWADSIEIFNDALTDAGVTHHGSRVIRSIGFSAALTLFSTQGIFTACVNNSIQRPDIAQMCIDVGARMVSESKTWLSKVLGYALQKKVLIALGEETKADKIDKLLNANSLYSDLETKTSSLMIFDQELNDYWFTNLKLFGETKAIELATIEAIRLSRNPDYDPCPKNR